MKKRTFIVASLLAMATSSMAQLSLDSCLKLARQNYPAIKQYSLVDKSRDFSMSNAAKGYLPQVSVSGTAATFTDPVDLGMMGDLDNTLYNVGLTVKQNIYDGGAIVAKRRTAVAQAEVERKRLDVTMYDVDGRVEELYFSILVIDAQLAQTATLIDDLNIGKRTVEAMRANGIANQSDVDAVDVEMAKARQREVALKASRRAYAEMLATFIGDNNSSLSLTIPQGEGTATHKVVKSSPLGEELERDLRPELSYFAAQSHLLDERRHALDVGLRPRLNVFGTAMYHSKPLAMMNNSLLVAGLTLSWNIGSLYTRKNDIRNIENDRAKIDSEREIFQFNTTLQSQQSQGNIDNLRQQLQLDNEIVSLRESIKSKAEKKVKLGTETINEMLRDINAASEARQQRDIHEIQLVKEIYKYKRIKGE